MAVSPGSIPTKRNCDEDLPFHSLLQNMDVLAQILHHLSSPRDLLAAASVCRTWRVASFDTANLRCWIFDDSLVDSVGLKASSAPPLPKTPPPKKWINPTLHSPLAAFKTPRSLMPLTFPCTESLLTTPIVSETDESSPKTPSPRQNFVKENSILDIVKDKMLMGRFLNDIDICSSRMTDEAMQTIWNNCPHLHTFRFLDMCSMRLNSNLGLLLDHGDSLQGCFPSLLASCGCGSLSEKAFMKIHELCPQLSSVTLVLHHIIFRKSLQMILEELGRLPKLHTLSMELRMPSFGQSSKSKLTWDSHIRFTDKEIIALVKAGPPPLHALALNRCDLTEVSVSVIASAFPNLDALDLHSDLENPKDEGFPATALEKLSSLASLSAAAFGVIANLEKCHFERWKLPALRRLRIESREALSSQHLHGLKSACPQLESLHLIWDTYKCKRETHLYPFSEALLDYASTA